MRIALLGANGNIGKIIRSKFNVTPITRNILDLTNSKDVNRYFNSNAYDVVINAAINSDSRMNAEMSVAKDNLNIFTNLYTIRNSFGKFIQFGSGAEFDRTRSISNVKEEEIFNSNPSDAYGMSKNICSRISFTTENWYTLRLFGTFHSRESSERMLSKILTHSSIIIEDRYFDYFYLEDLFSIILYYIESKIPKYKDINLTYPRKMLLSEFVSKFCQINNLSDNNIKYGNYNELSYTGNCDKLQSLNFSLLGIDLGLKKYGSK